MKINITKKQYEVLIQSLEISGCIYGPMSDFVDDIYKKKAKEIDEMTSHLLGYAKDFDFKFVDEYGGKLFVEDEYGEKMFDDLMKYDEYMLHQNISNKLAWRDFCEKYGEVEIEKMKEEHGGYLGVPLYDFEKKYWDEFEKFDYNRLYIKNSSKANKSAKVSQD